MKECNISDIAIEGSVDQLDAVINDGEIIKSLLAEIKPVDFRELSGLTDGEGLSNRHYVIISIQEIIKIAIAKKWAMAVQNGIVYFYNGRFWKQLSKQELPKFFGEAAEKLGVDVYNARYHAFRNDLQKQFLSTAQFSQKKKSSNDVLINLKNGTYVFTENQSYLKSFDMDDFLTYQLPFDYVAGFESPIFQAYLDKVLPDVDQQMVLSEFIAYIFTKHKTLKLEKSLILYGGGANGKSVFFEIISALLGPENISNFSLQNLTNQNGYSRAKIAGKLVNYASEISTTMDTTLFKQLVSGEPIEARVPYGEPFILEDYAKFIFNTNELPKDVEQNEAFFRRFIILDFSVTIPENERDPHLANKIIQSELPGVFNWVLKGLDRLLMNRKFTYSSAVESLIQKFRTESDVVRLFLQESSIVPDTNNEIPLKTLFDQFKTYCSESGSKVCSLKVFSDRIRNIGFKVHRKRHGNVVDAITIKL